MVTKPIKIKGIIKILIILLPLHEEINWRRRYSRPT